MGTDTKRTSWSDLAERKTRTWRAAVAYENEARIAAFRELVHRLRAEAGLTQAELAERMGTTQSAIARMEGGGTRPTLATLERLASVRGSIAKLERDGHAVVR